jgi:hypothetical protein
MTLRRALPLLATLLALAPAPAGAGGFIFAVGGAGLVAAGSGTGAAAVAGLALTLSHSEPGRPWSPESSLFLVEAAPIDAQITLNGRAVGTGRERGSYPLRLPPGIHTITIEAPGHQPLTRRFVIDGSGFMAKLRAELAPE